MSKAIATFALLALQFLVSYWVMTTAWGLTMQSWPVFVAGFLLSLAIAGAQVLVQASE